MRIGVDVMGGDLPPEKLFDSVQHVLPHLPERCSLLTISSFDVLPALEEKMKDSPQYTHRVEFLGAQEFISPEDPPLLAVRRKKNSSMALGIRLLRDKAIDGFITTGNTGALLATSILTLPLLKGIERPALLVVLPAGPKGMVVLDVGANSSFQPSFLVGYARLGSAYAKIIHDQQVPAIGLLNIGTEQEKGTKEIKDAFKSLQEHFSNQKGEFIGNIEGREAFQGKVDVLLTDGFTGNIFLKTCEGLVAHLLESLKRRFILDHATSGLSSLKEIESQFVYSKHPGAVLCGVDGLVIKCHGYSDEIAFANGIKGAAKMIEKNFIPRLKQELEE